MKKNKCVYCGKKVTKPLLDNIDYQKEEIICEECKKEYFGEEDEY